MFRVMSAGAMLFVLASVAAASEHYVEVWNPPEARLVKPAGKCKPKAAGKPALLAHSMPKAAAHRVADPLTKAASVKHTGGDVPRKSVAAPAADIPRIITPEGNVLRVSGGTLPVAVIR